jgi:hypothetical protein
LVDWLDVDNSRFQRKSPLSLERLFVAATSQLSPIKLAVLVLLDQ